LSTDVIDIPVARHGDRKEKEVAGKAMTIRFDEQQAEELEAVARVDGVPISETIREAIDKHIQERRRDEEFQARLRASLKRNREILEKLAR
jgi:predicted DNA-binding protein